MDDPWEIRRQLHLAHDNGGGLTEKGQGSPTPAMLGLLNGKLQEIFAGDDNKRISLLRWLWGIEQSSKELTFGQVKATLDWLIDQEASYKAVRVRDGAFVDIYVVSAQAWSACHAIITTYCEERGQMPLL